MTGVLRCERSDIEEMLVYFNACILAEGAGWEACSLVCSFLCTSLFATFFAMCTGNHRGGHLSKSPGM